MDVFIFIVNLLLTIIALVLALMRGTPVPKIVTILMFLSIITGWATTGLSTSASTATFYPGTWDIVPMGIFTLIPLAWLFEKSAQR